LSLSLPAALQAAAGRLRPRDLGVDDEAIQDALRQLTLLAAACADDRTRFAESVALATEVDMRDPRADRVSLLTIHAAKGLEFPAVFIVGLEDGLLPLYWNENALDVAAMAEERRLFYVGMTRAKDRLILSRTMERYWRGRARTLGPSPFLSDIEDALLRNEHHRDTRRESIDKQLVLF
jgi:superfamily I DNA/RNA helicase